MKLHEKLERHHTFFPDLSAQFDSDHQFNRNSYSEYLVALNDDFRNVADWAWDVSRPNTPKFYRSEPQFSIIPSFRFEANIREGEENRAMINISEGVCLSLMDLFYRSCSNSLFFSFEGNENEANEVQLWKGCSCFWSSFVSDKNPPIRFYDYQITPMFEDHSLKKNMGHFLEAAPIADRDRMQTARLMSWISLVWIILHEESHYAEGHTNYLKKFMGVSTASLDGKLPPKDEAFPDLSDYRSMELAADQIATCAIFDIFFTEGYIQYLPDYCRGNPEWLFRLLVTSIGGTLQIIQRSHHYNGTSELYPSTHTRLASLITEAINQSQKTRHAQFLNEQLAFSKALATSIFAIDDINAISCLINREKGRDASFSGEAPVREEKFRNGLLDERQDVFNLHQVMLAQFKEKYARHEYLSELNGNLYRVDPHEIYEKWFREKDALNIHYEGFRARILSRHRNEILL